MDDHPYIERLLEDLEADLPLVWGRRLRTLFIGGGTPSLIRPESMLTLLSAIRARLPMHGDVEITMEANPGTLNLEKLEGYRRAGVNRLSLGVQSFQNRLLQKIERIHTAEAAIEAYKMARGAGFANINFDLMYALPGQSPEEAMGDLQKAIDLGPEHISWYQLTIEPNTEFYHSHPPLPEEDLMWQMHEEGLQLLAKNGYQRYEISAFAKGEGFRCRHNLNYWQFGDYLGVGAGAHAKITSAEMREIKRYQKRRHPEQYLLNDSAFISGERSLELNDRAVEFMMNALRLTDGFSLELFCNTTGLERSAIAAPVQRAMDLGLLLKEGDWLKPSAQGLDFHNNLLHEFL